MVPAVNPVMENAKVANRFHCLLTWLINNIKKYYVSIHVRVLMKSTF